MSDRRRIPRVPRSSRPGSRRRRTAIGLAAVAALVALAGVVGTASDQGSDHADTTSSGAASSGSAGMGLSRSPATTVPPGANAYADSTADDADTKAGSLDEQRQVTTDAAADGAEAAPTGSDTGAPAPPGVEPKIIRTGSLELVVRKGTFGEAVADLTSVATGLGGFVSSSETSQLDGDPRGTITLRVPAKQFDRVLARITKLGSVESSTTASQDVTGEYTDIDSRIRALEDERDQILLVLSRAETIPDILSVRDRLSSVQSELEQLQGRQQVLDDQTSLSTIAVSLREKGSTTTPISRPAPERTGVAKLWHDSADRFGDGIRSIALGFAVLAPWILLALVLWLPGRYVWRRLAAPVADATVEPAKEPTPVG